MELGKFVIAKEKNGLMEIRNGSDDYNMNWIQSGKVWGECICPTGMDYKVERKMNKRGRMTERYIFWNNTDMDFFLRKHTIGIKLPFADSYESADICMKERCHTHIWCGGASSYIYGLRMGGESPHLGLVLTDGELESYSIEREVEVSSNQRGTVIVHPAVRRLKPQEKLVVEWEVFWFADVDDFFRIMHTYPTMLDIRFDKTVHFIGEELQMFVYCGTLLGAGDEVKIACNGKLVDFSRTEKDGGTELYVDNVAETMGEECWEIWVNGRKSVARTLVMSKVYDLAFKRSWFVTKKQQFMEEGNPLHGAFLIYDNETGEQYYSKEYDHNGGRERTVMGTLLARFLQSEKNTVIQAALETYTEYVHRELFDKETGVVYNDAGRDNTWNRLYNYPWLAQFFVERYHLYGQKEDLIYMYRILSSYYAQGGSHFYAIGIPMEDSILLLKVAEMEEEWKHLLKCYIEHAEYILEQGVSYPAHEVNYEQSIVAPAVTILLQVYRLTEEKLFLQAGKEQLKILELFNGQQPDYHLYETAIRHWDGYWFGKNKMYGDTFPHYWSALTGLAYRLYGKITGDETYLERAECSLRNVLSLIHEDGSAGCAYLYPAQVNGQKADYCDPWANDQDWGLYFYLCCHR